MKISKSKQELARIISENGGWRDWAGWSVFGKKSMAVVFVDESNKKPIYDVIGKAWPIIRNSIVGEFSCSPFPNWHQTILSRDEYLHLYPAPDAKPEFCESVMRSIPEPEYKPSIEQLMQTCADRANSVQLANEHLATCTKQANEAMEALSVACKAAGLDVSPITEKQGPELVITDWRDLQVGDEVEARCHAGVLIGFITEMEPKDYDGERPFRFQPFGESTRWCTSSKFKFIHRP